MIIPLPTPVPKVMVMKFFIPLAAPYCISPDEKQLEKGKETEIHLDVNDKDLYEDANRMREENEEIEESESQERPRGFRR
jgi:hypothetical protein